MERLFSPCTRYRDAESLADRVEFGGNPEGLRELNLNVSTEELLSAERAFTYADLYAMMGNDDTVVWLTPHSAVMRTGGKALLCCSTLLAYRFLFNVDGKEIFAAARSSTACSEISAVVGRLLAVNASEVYELTRLKRRVFQSSGIIQRSYLCVSDGAVPKSEGSIIN
jgi:hypothetical protein